MGEIFRVGTKGEIHSTRWSDFKMQEEKTIRNGIFDDAGDKNMLVRTYAIGEPINPRLYELIRDGKNFLCTGKVLNLLKSIFSNSEKCLQTKWLDFIWKELCYLPEPIYVQEIAPGAPIPIAKLHKIIPIKSIEDTEIE